MSERPEIQPDDRADWRAWLSANHASSGTIWLVFWKKQSGRQKLTYEQAVLEALCFGWIDGQLSAIDDHRYRQLFAPRKPKSVWSATNKRRIESLLASGAMAPAGLRAIEVAKENGSWTSLDAIEAMEAPPSFTAALARKPKLRAFFDGLSAGNRKGFLYFIGTPRTEAGRARRLEVALQLLEGGHTLRDYYFTKGAAQRLKERAGPVKPSSTATSTTKKSPTKKSPTKNSLTKASPAKKSLTMKSPTKKSPTKKSPTKRSPTHVAVKPPQRGNDSATAKRAPRT
ncbi:MAG: YdeI/OmpD-associated family protein [Deltaproteobacteria bacterium]|nr:YdeI/OmpD-associated family protein [Deltaproteobacteria bacterium]